MKSPEILMAIVGLVIGHAFTYFALNTGNGRVLIVEVVYLTVIIVTLPLVSRRKSRR
ncbi:hypothetical protein [Nonomuraea soli]|uniref:Uncharacterized protein n=1 Tax=Nonomuraea soli TaxID=1032476 RepID=A0A7W0CNS8_9ACTN|nr:hypothetical protein [Nonomuraea soli]MBA2894449.1 hypothetical protein [Nonomuraea soli]